MAKTGIKLKRFARYRARSDRRDHTFTIASVALMLFFVVAGCGAWMFRSISPSPSPTSNHAAAFNDTHE
jgi:hypothetical protein